MSNIGVKFEDYVAELLSKLGFNIVGRRVRIMLNGSEVGEVDIVAEDRAGNRYAIEVKAGKIDVTGVRQAYVNAKLLNAVPLIVARGFSNTSAESLARELGVNTIVLEDNVVLRQEELLTAVELAVYRIIDFVLSNIESAETILRDAKLSAALTRCEDWGCVCRETGVSSEECGRLIQGLREKFGKNISVLKLRVLLKLARLLGRALQE